MSQHVRRFGLIVYTHRGLPTLADLACMPPPLTSPCACTPSAAWKTRANARYGATAPAEGRLYLGLVESTSGGKAQVRVGEKIYPLPSAARTPRIV
jgi:hypothetical protein